MVLAVIVWGYPPFPDVDMIFMSGYLTLPHDTWHSIILFKAVNLLIDVWHPTLSTAVDISCHVAAPSSGRTRGRYTSSEPPSPARLTVVVL